MTYEKYLVFQVMNSLLSNPLLRSVAAALEKSFNYQGFAMKINSDLKHGDQNEFRPYSATNNWKIILIKYVALLMADSHVSYVHRTRG